MDNIQIFDEEWKRFGDKLRGKLMTGLSNRTLTLGYANVFLKEESLVWFDKYERSGNWLTLFGNENPEKAEIIVNILKQDLGFNKEIKEETNYKFIKYAIPAAAAVVGGGLAHELSGKLLTQLMGAAVPAVVLYPVATELEKNYGKDGKKKLIEDYILQLEKYRTSIRNVILN